MSGLPDVPAARVIEAIESLLFQAEAIASWETVRSARRLLGTLLPEEPDPITTMTKSSPSMSAALEEALAQLPEEPPPRPSKSPRQSPKPRG